MTSWGSNEWHLWTSVGFGYQDHWLPAVASVLPDHCLKSEMLSHEKLALLWNASSNQGLKGLFSYNFISSLLSRSPHLSTPTSLFSCFGHFQIAYLILQLLEAAARMTQGTTSAGNIQELECEQGHPLLTVISIKRADQELALIQALPASLRCWEVGSQQTNRVTKRYQHAV